MQNSEFCDKRWMKCVKTLSFGEKRGVRILDSILFYWLNKELNALKSFFWPWHHIRTKLKNQFIYLSVSRNTQDGLLLLPSLSWSKTKINKNEIYKIRYRIMKSCFSFYSFIYRHSHLNRGFWHDSTITLFNPTSSENFFIKLFQIFFIIDNLYGELIFGTSEVLRSFKPSDKQVSILIL